MNQTFRLLIFSLVFPFLVQIAAAHATNHSENQEHQHSVNVVTSTPLLRHLTELIGGPDVSVVSILDDHVDPHYFEPTPGDLKNLSAADLVIIHGLGYDEWVSEFPEVLAKDDLLLNLGRNVKNQILTDEECADDHGHHHHDHGITDPHAWMDPENVIMYLEKISASLTAHQPELGPVFDSRLKFQTTKLRVLDSWIQSQIAHLPPEKRALLMDHNSLGYFAQAYGINVHSLATTHYSEVDMKTFSGISNWARENQIRVIFVSSLRNPEQFEQVRSDLGINSIEQYYVDQLPSGEFGTYEEMMIHNTLAIVQALK